jgi:hypothetical protein
MEKQAQARVLHGGEPEENTCGFELPLAKQTCLSDIPETRKLVVAVPTQHKAKKLVVALAAWAT